ncbi:type I-E CRISPR-associated protein Cas7/Cse4/CasC [Segnochrobactraceae bacterium EtOH-i3]
MTTFVQLHALTFVPPANLNRDDMGRPKTAVLGGQTRLRLSSQSLKRAWRESDVFATELAGHLGHRTQRFGTRIQDHLLGLGIPEAKATEITREVIAAFGKPKSEKDDSPLYTEQLAFLSPEEQQAALDFAAARARGEAEKLDPKKTAQRLLRGADTAADIAMFGRMFADNADFNREAAVQVAHAVTTHQAAGEDDFYTAVDDLKKKAEDAGAGFVGDAGFGSGVFYFYLCIDTDLLIANLGGDRALARAAVGALVRAATTVLPGGKQKSFAALGRASYARVEKGTAQPRTLAAAFARGVTLHDDGTETGDLLAASIHRLEHTAAAFDAVYGAGDVTHTAFDVTKALSGGEAGSLDALVAFATGFGGADA